MPGLRAHAIPVLLWPNDMSIVYVRVSLRRLSEAWRSEFWPPAAAESALALVSTLARKCAWLSIGIARRQFAIAVPGVSCRLSCCSVCLAFESQCPENVLYHTESVSIFFLSPVSDTLHQ